MEPAVLSRASTPPENEPVMDCCLVLTALSGMTTHVSLSVAKFDRFEDLEDQVMDCLASVTDLKVFGCSIDFLHLATQTYLEDPIWDKLQQSMEYCMIFRDCAKSCPRRNSQKGVPFITSRLLCMSQCTQRKWPRKGPLQAYHAYDMSALSQVSDSSAQMLGKTAGSSESSKCQPLSLALLTVLFETANCSTVSLHLAAESSATKSLRSAALYNVFFARVEALCVQVMHKSP